MAIMAMQTLLGRNTWPPTRELRELWDEIDVLRGLRVNDQLVLESLARAFGFGGDPPYLTLPMAKIVARLKANLLFGEPPDIRADQISDQPLLDDLISENALPAELNRAAAISASEGEVFGRICIDPQTLGWPIIEFVSRRWVIPRFAGRFLTGAVFIKEWPEGSSTVWRLLEDYGPGSIECTLWRGTSSQLGEQRPLSARPETYDLPEGVIPTGLTSCACVFVPNLLDEDVTRGISDYLGVVMGFLAVNETASIGQQNARTTGLKRLFVDGRYRNSRGNLPAGQDIFWTDSALQDALGAGGGIKEAQYSFESRELTDWFDHIIDLVLIMAGVAPNSIARDFSNRGAAVSGTALRLRMSHTLMEAAGSGRIWDREASKLLRMAQQLDAMHFNRSWQDPSQLPAIERQDGLPRDTMEEAQETATLATAGALSLETKVRRVHPEWSDEQVADEQEKIAADQAAATPSAPNPIGQASPTATAALDAARGRLPNPLAPRGGTS